MANNAFRKVPDHQHEPGSKHMHEASGLGHEAWPEDGIEENDVGAAIGIMTQMGFCRRSKKANLWNTRDLSGFCIWRELKPDSREGSHKRATTLPRGRGVQPPPEVHDNMHRIR